MSDDEDVANERQDVGRQVSAHERELFVSCEPALALQQQFEHLHPEFIAVHDIAGSASHKLLTSIAAASNQSLQKLIIRRQGYGTPLATLQFAELPTASGMPLRIYTTETDADSASRHGLARVLLAFSRLGVVMVGDAPPQAIAAALKPLHDDMLAGPWRNRHLLMLPLASASALVSLGMDLARGTGVNVRTTPQVTRPADAWSYINATWARVHDGASPASIGAAPDNGWASGRSIPAPLREVPPAPTATRPAALTSASAFAETQIQAHVPTPPAPARPMPAPEALAMRAMPTVQAAATAIANANVTPATLMDRYVRQLSELSGMVSCCVFELATGREFAHAGASPGPAELSAHGSELMAAMISSARTLGLGFAMPEAAITLGAHHLLLRPVPRHAGLALHAVLDKTNANLTLARLQVQRMDALFDEGGPTTR